MFTRTIAHKKLLGQFRSVKLCRTQQSFRWKCLFSKVRQGWTKDTLMVGEKITVQYFPLKDGRTGGYFIKAIHPDGSEIIGDPFAPGVAEAAKKTPALPTTPR